MNSISIKAVLIGSVFGFVLMIVLITVLGALYPLLFSDATVENYEQSWFSMLALAAPVAAGYLAARIARTRPVAHGALSPVLNVLWGLVAMIFLIPATVFAAGLLVANVLLGALGGYIYALTHGKN
ncbi:hypothetical protein [Parvibaculum sp.]|jgi:hypothetical protein|uniref:hypothetical protein n=1 Tax=Parvibaculum sp. TaxID=2024848 RepID=UPI001B12D96E|nr:hypothetical protein [Parvibaculum sp.]MBO6635355.1 hypothetical protein [Parvibaculum sp.]MBO6678455.1 hypothetical protein [Parvibaculum sp.]MBO6686229.1 hypothetical protein [Parvibaculum sp.]MBO6905593.1 hypothetical protein [Parvibaculum sp.]